MDYTKYNQMMRKYIDEGNEIKESYDNAKETLLRQHEKALRRFNDFCEQFQEFKEAYKLGEVSEDNFKEVENEFNRAEFMVNETGKRLEEIEKYRKDILMSILQKQLKLKENYKMDIKTETEKLRFQLLKAKYDFLNLAVQLRKAYNKLSYEEYYHEKLKRELQLPSDVKELNAFQALGPSVMDDGAAISYRELSHALYFGMIPEELENTFNPTKQGELSK